MHPLFDKYIDNPKKNVFGIYEHKDVPLDVKGIDIPKFTNFGSNLESKLSFISGCEFIITNTYHGAYWATLCRCKVIVIPFKSSLLSFRHKPIFCRSDLTDAHLDAAQVYENSLSESRLENINFYNFVSHEFNLV